MDYIFADIANNMKLHSDAFYHSAIKNAFPNSWNLRTPHVPGGVSPVFMCDTPCGTYVCRFSDYDIVFRNHRASNLLALHDIPTPRTTIHAYLDSWFESYEYCPSPTFFERAEKSMSDAEIFDIYKQATDIQRQISDIPPADFKPERGKYMHEIFTTTQKMRVHPILAHTYGFVHRMFSNNGTMRIFHNDLNSKNILVDDNLCVSRLIDLDAIALCNESFSVLMTLRTYPLNNYDEYMDYYEDTMQRRINRRAIMGGLRFLNAIREPQVALNRLLWHGYNTPPGR